jgi:hypothetical protein
MYNKRTISRALLRAFGELYNSWNHTSCYGITLASKQFHKRCIDEDSSSIVHLSICQKSGSDIISLPNWPDRPGNSDTPTIIIVATSPPAPVSTEYYVRQENLPARPFRVWLRLWRFQPGEFVTAQPQKDVKRYRLGTSYIVDTYREYLRHTRIT